MHTEVLLPVDAIARINDKAVYINQTRQHIAVAPRYDPDLILQDVGDQGHVGDIYRHYNYLPYWGLGYLYPPYPHHR